MVADQAEITAFSKSEANLGGLCHKRRALSPLLISLVRSIAKESVALAKLESVTPVSGRRSSGLLRPSGVVCRLRSERFGAGCPELSCYSRRSLYWRVDTRGGEQVSDRDCL